MSRGPVAGWKELGSEAIGLGLFMLSAVLFTALLEHPASPLRSTIADAGLRRGLVGVAMGLTAVLILYSPFAALSGGHLNPAVTLAFYRLGRIGGRDALGYVLAQCAGGALGVGLGLLLLPSAVTHPSVNYVVTEPGSAGVGAALLGECVVSFAMMYTVLTVGGFPRLAPRTPLFAGALLALFIWLEAPYSGMSMNPARSLASAVWAAQWRAFWLYVVVPPLSMLLAAEAYVRVHGAAKVGCAKLHHGRALECIYCALVEYPVTPQADAQPHGSQRP